MLHHLSRMSQRHHDMSKYTSKRGTPEAVAALLQINTVTIRMYDVVTSLIDKTIVSILPPTLSAEVGDREEMVSRDCISKLHTLGIQIS